MGRLHALHLRARHNQWMNERVSAAAATLPEDALALTRGAFFGSLPGTFTPWW
ncbi:hypothetical protein ACFOPN_02315 [Xanthomonas hyacinthi]|uniref:hypothetical protein n=1 Tax=Xanthomonas hyacinthi TaxID=56455 RepID=UPI001FCA6B90|nr:hypothetical protein [Xanthomonas hyacinthi]